MLKEFFACLPSISNPKEQLDIAITEAFKTITYIFVGWFHIVDIGIASNSGTRHN